ncbi:hypothetical protein CJ030_MR4G001643 [Morella rubra]|uniref:Uncharacterized protein n=1 Tax=Morella rubra TaxID=262757 RepID=A0A6A1VS03_9ROSI|nr:hypothetical protein CJ030_MR4G001643 [Morella rubra]
MRHRAITFYGEMKRGREFPSVTSGQLHSAVTPLSMSPIPSPTPSAPSPRVNEGISQGTPACPSSCASTSASKQDHFDLDYTRHEDKNQSSNINPAELYKKNYTNKDGIWTSEGAREIYERMDAFQRQCDLEGKTYTEIEVYSEILGKKSGYVRGLGRAVKPPPSSTLTTQSSDLQHQLAKARMR